MQIDSPIVVATQNPAADVDRLGDEIAELSAHLDAATARLLDLIREFDARGGWNNGFPSCAAWLSWRVGLDPGAARERVRVARALETLPVLAQALGRGELSYAKIRALTRVATPGTEERLLAVGRAGTAEHVERIVRGWRRVDRQAEAREAARQHKSRGLHVYQDEDGMVVLRGRLEPEAERCSSARWRPRARSLEDGARVPAETSRRLACDASRGWLGERLNLGWAIAVLHPLAQCPSTVVQISGPDSGDELPPWPEHREELSGIESRPRF